MKKQMFFIAAFAFSSNVLLAVAPSTGLSITLGKGNGVGTILYQLNGLDNQYTEIRICDLYGQEWYRESIKKAICHNKEVDLSQFPSGAYRFCVANNREQQSRPFQLNQGELVLLEQSTLAQSPGGLVLVAGGVRNLIARISVVDPRNLWVQLANLQEYRASIQMIALNGEVRWEKQLNCQIAFAAGIDLKALSVDPGSYFLVIRAGYATIVQEVKVKPYDLELSAAYHTRTALAKPGMAKR